MADIYIKKVSIVGGIESIEEVLLTDSEVLACLASLELERLTLNSTTKKWKLTVDDNGIIGTEEII